MRHLVVLLLLVLVRGAFADGKMWATSTGEVADMPSQRAFLSWQNGVETLIVESDFSGKPGEYTWLIPVPGRPDKIEALEPGALETLQTLMPIRLGRADGSLTFLLILAVIGAVVALNGRRTARSGPAWSWQLLILLTLLFVLSVILFPVFAGSTSKRGAETVGSFNVTVLGATENGISTEMPKDVPAKLRPVLDKYIAEGWSVVAAKLNRTEAGLATPHPLRIRFASKVPIYPMRLTGVDEDRLHLDLFVYGRWPAQHSALHRFSTKATNEDPKSGGWKPVGHPDLVPLFRNGFWLTRLSGTLGPAEMEGDLEISWNEDTQFPFENESALEPREALWVAFQWVLGVGAVAMIALGSLGFKYTAWSGWSRPLLWSLAIGAAVAVWQVVPVPKYERNRTLTTQRIFDRSHSKAVEKAVEYARSAKTGDEAEALFLRNLKDNGALPRHAVPGGFTLKRVGDKLEIAAYDWLAKRTVYTLPEQP